MDWMDNPMDDELDSWEGLVARLEQVTWVPDMQTQEGTLYISKEPLDLPLNGYDWYFEEPPPGIVRDTLLSFLWDSSGAPISWDGILDLIQVGSDAGYVFLYMEGSGEDMYSLLGKVVPANAAGLYRALFLDLMRHGGDLHILPDYTTNGRPDLIDKQTVRQGYWYALDYLSAENGNAWTDVRQRLDEPMRGLLFASDRPEETSSSDDSPDKRLSEEERRDILDRYFDKCYEEAAHG